MAPDGRLAEFRVRLAEREAGAEQAGLAGGVDDDFGADESSPVRRPLKRPRRRREPHADGAVAFEDDFEHAGAAMDFDALLRGVVEQELIELRPLHVPRAAALARVVPREQKRRRLLAAAADELHADLFDERALLQAFEHAQPLEHPIRLGHQRFADLAARLDVALQEQRAITGVGHQRRRRRATRPAADHDAVVFS